MFTMTPLYQGLGFQQLLLFLCWCQFLIALWLETTAQLGQGRAGCRERQELDPGPGGQWHSAQKLAPGGSKGQELPWFLGSLRVSLAGENEEGLVQIKEEAGTSPVSLTLK